MSLKRYVAAVCGLICGLTVAIAPTAAAGTAGATPAVTWVEYSPSFKVQQEGCGKVSNLTFQLTCTKSGASHDRAERRYADYTGGSHKFEGSFKITSQGGSRISLKQTFHGTQGPYFLLAVENGGRLYAVEDQKTIATGATVGTAVTVDTVQTVGKTLQVYINGSLKYTASSPSGTFYDKFGAYRTSSGQGPITVQWSNLHFWHQ
jgi:hypothetical protein